MGREDRRDDRPGGPDRLCAGRAGATWSSSTCPSRADPVTDGEPFADVESVKAVSDVYSPVTGVAAVNEELLDRPQLINESPYEAWFVVWRRSRPLVS